MGCAAVETEVETEVGTFVVDKTVPEEEVGDREDVPCTVVETGVEIEAGTFVVNGTGPEEEVGDREVDTEVTIVVVNT